MSDTLLTLKHSFYNELDSRAKDIAADIDTFSATTKILATIQTLYTSAQAERLFKSETFDCAYHNPITSEFEFLLARILGHYLLECELWLRRQQNKIAPDICLRHKGQPIAVIEIKSKAGWIQPFFSSEREKKDIAKFNAGAKYNPQDDIQKIRGQLLKYADSLGISNDKIFMLLPTLALVHRKKSPRQVEDYITDFSTNSHLPKENLILLSNNMSLDLAKESNPEAYMPTKQFESFAIGVKNKLLNA